MSKNPGYRRHRYHRRYTTNVKPPSTLWAAAFRRGRELAHITADQDPYRLIVEEGSSKRGLLIGEYKLVRSIKGKLTVDVSGKKNTK